MFGSLASDAAEVDFYTPTSQITDVSLVGEIGPPIPLELLAYGLDATLRAVGKAQLRDVPPSPDGGVIADFTGPVGDPGQLAARLAATPGVVKHGLFPPELVSDVLVGRGEDVERLEPQRP